MTNPASVNYRPSVSYAAGEDSLACQAHNSNFVALPRVQRQAEQETVSASGWWFLRLNTLSKLSTIHVQTFINLSVNLSQSTPP